MTDGITGTDKERSPGLPAGSPGAVPGPLDAHVHSPGCGCGHDHGPAVRRVVGGQKAGRNDPCPCGSGRKHKKCCGRGG